MQIFRARKRWSQSAGFSVALNLIGALLLAGLSNAQLPALIEPLGPADQAKSRQQQTYVDQLARRRLGTPLRGGDLQDLNLLQRLLDAQFVEPDDIAGQQALGLALGNVMASGLGLHWVVIDDEVGRSRALQLDETQHLFFPITMVSKRTRHHEPVDFHQLYQQVQQDVTRLRTRSAPAGRRFIRPIRPVPDPILEKPQGP